MNRASKKDQELAEDQVWNALAQERDIEGAPYVNHDEAWEEKLTPEQYNILREKGTEAPFTGKYVNHHADGIYTCAGCGTPLFDSSTKFDSGSGWPSFFDVVSRGNVELRDDTSMGMTRTEVVCKTCGGHLGHKFSDGPDPMGKRYCINSACLNFKPKGI